MSKPSGDWWAVEVCPCNGPDVRMVHCLDTENILLQEHWGEEKRTSRSSASAVMIIISYLIIVSVEAYVLTKHDIPRLFNAIP